jgi:hypothetical protein
MQNSSKFPVNFPVNGNLGAETGSQQTGSSARQSEAQRIALDLVVMIQDNSHEFDGAAGYTLFGAPHVALGLVGSNRAYQPLGKRIHFVVQKPFTKDLFRKTLKVAYGAIASSRRLSSRHEVCIDSISSCLTHCGERRTLKMTILNISHGGMCVQTGELLPQGSEYPVEFFNFPAEGPWKRPEQLFGHTPLAAS